MRQLCAHLAARERKSIEGVEIDMGSYGGDNTVDHIKSASSNIEDGAMAMVKVSECVDERIIT